MKAKRVLSIILIFGICWGNSFSVHIPTVEAAENSVNINVNSLDLDIDTEDSDETEDEELGRIAFDYDFNIQSTWEKHYNAEMTIKNTSSETIENWELAFRFDGKIENIWNAKVISHDGNEYIIKNAAWNQDIAPQESVSFGMTVQYDGERPDDPYDLDIEKMEDDITDGCRINFEQFTQYGNTIQGQFEITNNTEETIEDWSLDFESNFEINNIWNAKIDDSYYTYSEDNDEQITGMSYKIKNAGYNQNIEPGQTVNFGFIADLSSGNTSEVTDITLYQLTVIPEDDEEEAEDEDMYIYEGDPVDDTMSIVEDEELDEDDMDRMNEEESAQMDDNTSDGVTLYGTTSIAASSNGKESGDKISYYIKGLAHKKQVQTWCKVGDDIFVAQNDEKGNAVISCCRKNLSEKAYVYLHEIQIAKAGHLQSLYCYKKTGEKYYFLINAHGVTYKEKGGKSVWGSRFSRVVYNFKKKAEGGKKYKNIFNLKNEKDEDDKEKQVPVIKATVKSDKLKYFKAVAYARKDKKPFNGMSKRKGVAKLKRCDFSVSNDGKYMIIWKKSDSNLVEYSLFDWKKLKSNFARAKKYFSFNTDAARKCCKSVAKETEKYAKRSFQGIAIANDRDIVITSGNDKKSGADEYIALLYKNYNKKKNAYTGTSLIRLEKPNKTKATWMRKMVANKLGIKTENVPMLEIEGAYISNKRLYFAIGIVNGKNTINIKDKDKSWRTRSFIFSRKLSEIRKAVS